MIRSFKCAYTQELSKGNRVKRFVNISKIARRKLRQLEIANRLDDLRVPPAIIQFHNSTETLAAKAEQKRTRCLQLLEERVRIEIGEHIRTLRADNERFKGEMAGKGALRSGMTIKRITDLCASAVKNRAQIVWQTLFRFITTSGISYYDELSSDLKVLVAQHW